VGGGYKSHDTAKGVGRLWKALQAMTLYRSWEDRELGRMHWSRSINAGETGFY